MNRFMIPFLAIAPMACHRTGAIACTVVVDGGPADHFDLVLAPGTPGAPSIPGCRTVETDWGTCLEAGTYEGDLVLLVGHHPFVHGLVEADFHGAEIPIMECPDGSTASICAKRLPFGNATITVRPESP